MKDKPILKTIKVVKIDSETKEIIKDKFEFAIYEDKECTKLIKKVEVDSKDNFILFEDLRFSTIYLKETKAPKGYLLSEKVVEIVINDEGVYADGEVLEENNAICTISYSNEKEPVIKTGIDINYELVLCIAIISLIGIGIGYITLKRTK